MINTEDLKALELDIPEGYELRLVKKEVIDIEDLREQIKKINNRSGVPNFQQYTEKNNNLIVI